MMENNKPNENKDNHQGNKKIAGILLFFSVAFFYGSTFGDEFANYKTLYVYLTNQQEKYIYLDRMVITGFRDDYASKTPHWGTYSGYMISDKAEVPLGFVSARPNKDGSSYDIGDTMCVARNKLIKIDPFRSLHRLSDCVLDYEECRTRFFGGRFVDNPIMTAVFGVLMIPVIIWCIRTLRRKDNSKQLKNE